jgi:hypothetical protein
MRRLHLFFAFLLVIYVLFGSPYAALLLNRAMGPWDASAVHHDGSVSHQYYDQDRPPPAFVPVYPRASVVQSVLMFSTNAPSGVGLLDLAVHGSLDEVRDFYRIRLEAGGFAVEDLGTLGLNAAAADYLGVAGTLFAKRQATDDSVSVQIRTEEGVVVRSRLVQLSWRKLSEWPAGQPKP